MNPTNAISTITSIADRLRGQSAFAAYQGQGGTADVLEGMELDLRECAEALDPANLPTVNFTAKDVRDFVADDDEGLPEILERASDEFLNEVIRRWLANDYALDEALHTAMSEIVESAMRGLGYHA